MRNREIHRRWPAGAVREALLTAVEGAMSDRRWLVDRVHERVPPDLEAPLDSGAAEATLAWAERAVALHAARCPCTEPMDCIAGALPLAAVASALYGAGRFEEALAAFGSLQSLPRTQGGFPSTPAVLAWQSLCLERLGRHEEARETLALAEAADSTIHTSRAERRAVLEPARRLVGH